MRIYTYSIPIATAIFPFSDRQGLILEIGQGYGEAAPLPGFSRETLNDALTAVRTKAECPSSDFAICSALAPFPTSYPAIQISALASNRMEAETALQNGYRTVKIKVKNYSVQEAIDLMACLPKKCRWRIDVNRCWNREEALHFFRSIDPSGIEYVEEPLKDLRHLHELSTLPIALDETLLNDDAEQWIRAPQVQALILKPTLLGRRLDHLIELGRKYEKKLVFSSSFESAIGLLHIAHLQAKWAPNIAAGLDTYRAFLNNFLPLAVQNGMLMSGALPPLDRRWLIESVY